MVSICASSWASPWTSWCGSLRSPGRKSPTTYGPSRSLLAGGALPALPWWRWLDRLLTHTSRPARRQLPVGT
eukprot:6159900-Alexandrium_andersonii.AAC.1